MTKREKIKLYAGILNQLWDADHDFNPYGLVHHSGYVEAADQKAVLKLHNKYTREQFEEVVKRRRQYLDTIMEPTHPLHPRAELKLVD